jgi:hypothetical protein
MFDLTADSILKQAGPDLKSANVCPRRRTLGALSCCAASAVDAAALRREDFEVKDEDVGRPPPLGHEHINMLGRYAFSLPDRIARDELRMPIVMASHFPPCIRT